MLWIGELTIYDLVQVEARLEGDTWIVLVNGQDRYEVPLALIEGG